MELIPPGFESSCPPAVYPPPPLSSGSQLGFEAGETMELIPSGLQSSHPPAVYPPPPLSSGSRLVQLFSLMSKHTSTHCNEDPAPCPESPKKYLTL